ncbi:hypothetical protein ACFS07_36185 [Undibacterium arcticum]
MSEIEDVVGSFRPSDEQPRSDRIYGTLHTHDANVRIGFDVARVALPPLAPSTMRVSGKLWLDENTSGLMVLVREYKLLSDDQHPQVAN